MSMAKRDGSIWVNGNLVDWEKANFHVLTHSLHYGLSVFEGIRAYKTPKGTAIFKLEDHIERLFNSAKIYQMKIPYQFDEIVNACKEVVKINKLDSCYIRPLVFYGSEKMGLSPVGCTVNVVIAAWPWGAYLGPEALENGIRVKTSSFQRHHVNVTMCRAKVSGAYINSILATQEASSMGYDEALLLDTDGFVAEGAGENLFIIKNNKIYEPELTSALIGITRETIIKLANDLGFPIHSQKITRDDIYLCDEAFFTGTAAEVTPIKELDERIIGKGIPGPITKKIQSAFFDIFTDKNNHENWLTYL